MKFPEFVAVFGPAIALVPMPVVERRYEETHPGKPMSTTDKCFAVWRLLNMTEQMVNHHGSHDFRATVGNLWAPKSLIPPTRPNTSHRFVDRGVVFRAGPQGSMYSRLHGMISPCRVWQENNSLWMEFVGSDGDRPDGGPAHRRLLRTESPDDGATWSTPRLMTEWSPAGNVEEGVFNGTRRYFSAVTAENATTESVSSDIRLRSDRSVVLDHRNRDVWGYGDELFVHSEIPGGGLLYIAKGQDVRWGLGQLLPNGSTRALITPRSPSEYVIGNGSVGRYFVLVRGFDAGGSVIEWYDSQKLPAMVPIYSARIGSRHVTPYWDGKTWWLYGRHPKGNEIRRWELVEQASVAPDELYLGDVEWLHTNISAWPITSRIERVKITGRELCIFHTMAGKWPVFVDNGTAVEGNPWVFANINGQWYGATYEWLRPGQTCKGITRENIGPHTKKNPVNRWVPRSGELVGFAVSTLARSDLRTSNERSNIVLVNWP